jgi:hypothetical protein
MADRDHYAMPIRTFTRKAGIGHTKTYELIGEREIESVLVGRRRLVIWPSYLDFLDRQKRAQAAGIGDIPSPNPRAHQRDAAAASDPALEKKRPVASPPTARRLPGRPPSRPARPRGAR